MSGISGRGKPTDFCATYEASCRAQRAGASDIADDHRIDRWVGVETRIGVRRHAGDFSGVEARVDSIAIGVAEISDGMNCGVPHCIGWSGAGSSHDIDHDVVDRKFFGSAVGSGLKNVRIDSESERSFRSMA